MKRNIRFKKKKLSPNGENSQKKFKKKEKKEKKSQLF